MSRDAERDTPDTRQTGETMRPEHAEDDADEHDAGVSEAGAGGSVEGELRCGGLRWPIGGRTLRLMLWLARRQQRINEVASERGQLWITWKGNGPHSIDGEVKTRLSGE